MIMEEEQDVIHKNLYYYSYAKIILIFALFAGILSTVCYYPDEVKEGGAVIMAIVGYLGSSLKKMDFKFYGVIPDNNDNK